MSQLRIAQLLAGSIPFNRIEGSVDQVLHFLSTLTGPKRIFSIQLGSFANQVRVLYADTDQYEKVGDGGELIPKRFLKGQFDQINYDQIGPMAVVDGVPVMTITSSATDIGQRRLHTFAQKLHAVLFTEDGKVRGTNNNVLTLAQPVGAVMVATSWDNENFVFMTPFEDDKQQIRYGFDQTVMLAAGLGDNKLFTLTAQQITQAVNDGRMSIGAKWQHSLDTDNGIEMIGKVDDIDGAVCVTTNEGTHDKPKYGYVPVLVKHDGDELTLRAGETIEADKTSELTTIATIGENVVTGLDLNGAGNIVQRWNTDEVPVAKTLWQGFKAQTAQTTAAQ